MGGVGVDEVRIRAVAQQQRDESRTVRVDRGRQRGATLLVARIGQRALGPEEAFDRRRVAGPDGGVEARDAVRLRSREPAGHLGAQRAPARGVVLARDLTLGVGEARRGVGPAHLLETVLGELPEELEAGTIG